MPAVILELAGGCSAFLCPPQGPGAHLCLGSNSQLAELSQRWWLVKDLCLTTAARKPSVVGSAQGSGDFLGDWLLCVRGGSALHVSEHSGQCAGQEASFL